MYTTVKVVSLVDPKQTINMPLGPEKVVVIRNSGTVALLGPTTIGHNLRMVVLWDQS